MLSTGLPIRNVNNEFSYSHIVTAITDKGNTHQAVYSHLNKQWRYFDYSACEWKQLHEEVRFWKYIDKLTLSLIPTDALIQLEDYLVNSLYRAKDLYSEERVEIFINIDPKLIPNGLYDEVEWLAESLLSKYVTIAYITTNLLNHQAYVKVDKICNSDIYRVKLYKVNWDMVYGFKRAT